jgi:putative hydrolase of the HAD superfamily
LLIIFDLDDTLIDTSGCIVPIRLEKALREMIAAGLPVVTFSEAYERLLTLDRKAPSSRHTLKEFLEGVVDAERYFSIGEKIIYDSPLEEIAIHPFSGVVEILRDLSKSHQLAVVSQGKEALQMAKMKKAGIDSSLFCKIIVSENRSKKNHYEAVAAALKAQPSQSIVCGDKVQVDLLPAKELGMTTVHLRKGRGRWEPSGAADYQILEFAQIKDVIKKVQKK